MNLLSYQEAFGATDKTSQAMRAAIAEWFALYHDRPVTAECDPCQRIAYTVVNKLVKTTFGEYRASSVQPFTAKCLAALDQQRRLAVQLAMVGGESYLKPVFLPGQTTFRVIPRNNLLIFARSADGTPTDVGLAEQSTFGNAYFTLLERRCVDGAGYLTVTYRLYKAPFANQLGQQVALTDHPEYAALSEQYTFEKPLHSTGLIRLRTPMANCVDGSQDGVSVYAPAVGLIHNIDRNEAQLSGEFRRGESRIIASADLFRDGDLQDHLFVGLDHDPESLGLTVYSPQLRADAFLARKQEYLRNVESVVGLRRGMLSDANIEQRTATEISSSQGEHNLTVLDFQQMWEQAVKEAVALCAELGKLYGIADAEAGQILVDWGNGVLYDEEKTWADYKDMVARGMILPEIALGWRFGLDADTPEQRKAIRERFLGT